MPYEHDVLEGTKKSQKLDVSFTASTNLNVSSSVPGIVAASLHMIALCASELSTADRSSSSRFMDGAYECFAKFANWNRS